MAKSPTASTPVIPASANRLAVEKSPYLLQHAHNPVEWHPWGEAAFAKARHEQKPIFLSIGYSTCHWCHVMAHESFEDAETAAIMNREFVNIKVDREERPDVDRVYMTFLQATAGSGGWPLSVWLTPNLEPFVGGTYFPPEDRYGQPAFRSVLRKIAAAWKLDRAKIAEQGVRIVEALRDAQTGREGTPENLDLTVMDTAYDQFLNNYDAKQGGFGSAPKFPHPVTLNFLARFYARDPNRTEGSHALEMHRFTLRKMAAGGIHDHLGGGFHRYSVDRTWHVPHFEKMLYDQAQLALAYLDSFQITHDPEMESVVRDILGYVARDMTAKDGAFFSAEDADSEVPVAAVYDRRTDTEDDAHRASLQKPAHAEGAFYVWTQGEIDAALGADAPIFNFHYGVQPDGNTPPGTDPLGEFRGKNILIQRHTVGHTAAHFKKEEEEVRKMLEQGRHQLWLIRSKRPRPHLDDKIITAWNGLMISAFARAAAVLRDEKFTQIAVRAAQFVKTHLYDSKTKKLFRSYREGRGEVQGFADDYAFMIQGLLDLYEASFDVTWLQFATELQAIQNELFWDEDSGGYFSTTGKDQSVVLRMKDENDGAEPAPSSVAARNLLRLAQMEGNEEARERGAKTIAAFRGILSRFPSAMPQMLVALDFQSSPSSQIVVAGKAGAPDTLALLAEVFRPFRPATVVLLADGEKGQEYLGEKMEAMRGMSTIAGKAAAYVCENFTCQAPVTNPEVLREFLS